MYYIYKYLKDRFHKLGVKGIRVVKVKFSHVGQNNFMLIQFSVERVLGQRDHLLLRLGLVILAHGLHQPLAHCRLAAGRAALKVYSIVQIFFHVQIFFSLTATPIMKGVRTASDILREPGELFSRNFVMIL